MGSYDNAAKAAQTLVNLHLIPADVAAGLSNFNNPNTANEALGSGISAAKTALTLIEAVGKDVPYLGSLLSLSSLMNNLDQMSNEYQGLFTRIA